MSQKLLTGFVCGFSAIGFIVLGVASPIIGKTLAHDPIQQDQQTAETLLSGFAETWDDSKWENKFRGSLYMRSRDDFGWKKRMEIITSLVAGGEKSIPALEKFLVDKNMPTRVLAAQAIGFLAPLADVDRLIDVAKNDREPAVRLYAVDAIGKSGHGQEFDWDALAKNEKNRDVLKHINYAKERKDSAIPEGVVKSLADFDMESLDSAGVGKLAPDFKLTSVDGKEFSLGQYRGKQAVVLIFIYGDT